MIRVARGVEPARLAKLRIEKLAALNLLGREPTSDEIVGYRAVAEELWDAHHHKCCYCEQRVPKGFNDVEHYRPKCRADRRPGCTLTHGYWWLAFSWDNLLFACPACNRSGKNDLFPLLSGSVSLTAHTVPPGDERPLLLNPGALVNPVEHIEYVEKSQGNLTVQKYWWARPRNASLYGSKTIEVCDLNRAELRGLRNDHFDTVISPQIKALNNALVSYRLDAVKREYLRAMGLLEPKNIYVGFTYDALRASILSSKLKQFIGIGWPQPSQIC